MIFGTRPRLFNAGEQDGGSGDTGGSNDFDMATAVDSIGADLGFGDNEPDPDSGLADGGGNPQPTPAPTSGPTPAPTTAPTPSATPAPTPAPGTTSSTPPRFTADAPPTTWNAAAAAQWASLPEPIRAEIAKRENDMFRGLEQYKGEAGIGRDVGRMLQPILPDLMRAQVRPDVFLGNLVNAHMTLSNPQGTPEAKLAYVQKLAADYGIDLTGAAPVEGFIDPEVKALRETVSRLESRLNGEDANRAQQTRNALAAEIDTFAADPANTHFYAVADDMTLLIRADPKLSLKDAYDKAVWSNPTTRAQLTAADNAAAIAKAAKEASDKAAAARRRTGANVSTSGHQTSGTAATGSMDDTMSETLAAIKKRQA